MDTPANNDSLEKQQETDILGALPPRLRTLSWGERLLPYVFAAMEQANQRRVVFVKCIVQCCAGRLLVAIRAKGMRRPMNFAYV